MIFAKQHSAFSGFSYDLIDQAGKKIGSLNWPDFAEATNARLKNPLPGVLSTLLELICYDRNYCIEFEHTRRGWNNDIQFRLKQGSETIASADVKAGAFFKRSTITITIPFQGEVIRNSGIFSIKYEIRKDGITIGRVSDLPGIKIKREMAIDLPASVSAPVQAFIFFLVHNHAIST